MNTLIFIHLSDSALVWCPASVNEMQCVCRASISLSVKCFFPLNFQRPFLEDIFTMFFFYCLVQFAI